MRADAGGDKTGVQNLKVNTWSNSMAALIAFVWMLSLLGVIAAVYVLITGLQSATAAPQEAVVCALACALAIIPSCLARAVTELIQARKR